METKFQFVTLRWLNQGTVSEKLLDDLREIAEELLSTPDPHLEQVRSGLRELLQPSIVRHQIENGELFILAYINDKPVGVMNVLEKHNRIIDHYTAIKPSIQRSRIYAKLTLDIIRYAEKKRIPFLRRELVTRPSVEWHHKYQRLIASKPHLSDILSLSLEPGMKGGYETATFHIRPRVRRKPGAR
ncbi:MAG: hypothetical protein AABX02_04450 [archaeon]